MYLTVHNVLIVIAIVAFVCVSVNVSWGKVSPLGIGLLCSLLAFTVA